VVVVKDVSMEFAQDINVTGVRALDQVAGARSRRQRDEARHLRLDARSSDPVQPDAVAAEVAHRQLAVGFEEAHVVWVGCLLSAGQRAAA